MSEKITELKPNYGCLINLNTNIPKTFSLKFSTEDQIEYIVNEFEEETIHANKVYKKEDSPNLIIKDYDESLLLYNEDTIKGLRRCSKCILPETFPFISFDDEMICNYCKNYKTNFKGKDEFEAKNNFIKF